MKARKTSFFYVTQKRIFIKLENGEKNQKICTYFVNGSGLSPASE